MANVIEFNTGRHYASDGTKQPITAICGYVGEKRVLVFRDHARGIDGDVPAFPGRLLDNRPLDIQDVVMAAYDNGLYNDLSPRDFDELLRTVRGSDDGEGFSSSMPCCGPFAVSRVAGVPFDRAFNRIRKAKGRGANWRGRSNKTDCLQAIRHYGKSVTRRRECEGGSLGKFVDQHTDSRSKFFVRVGGHFVAVIGREIHDQTKQGGPAVEHWTRNKRVTDVYQIGGRR